MYIVISAILRCKDPLVAVEEFAMPLHHSTGVRKVLIS